MTENSTSDPTRRTRLANERTYLAWWRTGLTALAVSIGTGRLLPELTDGVRWPYTIVGAGFALLGIGVIWYSMIRHRAVDQALSDGDFVPPSTQVIAAMTAAGIALGALLLVIVLFEV